MNIETQVCPCGMNKMYRDCCGLFHNETALPETPEQLMRSRYSAYALKKISYIRTTMQGPALKAFDQQTQITLAQHHEWLGLDVVDAQFDPKNSNRATVEYRALHKLQGELAVLNELSEFARIDGRWYYIDGTLKKSGRNDPCPCRSGKKFKKCHG